MLNCLYLENDATEIIPNLWLSNCEASLNEKFLKEFNIKHIINVTHEIPNPFSYVIYLHLPINDDEVKSKNMNSFFDQSTEFIWDNLKMNLPVMVFCKRGHHRSASIIVAFLIRFFKLDYFDAIKYVVSKRPCSLTRKTNITTALFNYAVHRQKINN